jgi:hypothetical protein
MEVGKNSVLVKWIQSNKIPSFEILERNEEREKTGMFPTLS